MKLHRFVFIACVSLLLAGCVSQARFDESEAAHRAAQAQIAELQSERDALEARLLALEAAHDRLGARSEVMEEMVDTLRNLGACIRRLQLEIEN